MQRTDLREVWLLKVRGWKEERERAEGGELRDPPYLSLQPRGDVLQQFLDKWRAGVLAFGCPRAEDVIIIRGVSHRRLRDILWAAVCWEPPPSACPGDEMTYNLLHPQPAFTLHVWTNKYEQTQTIRSPPAWKKDDGMNDALCCYTLQTWTCTHGRCRWKKRE